MQTALGVMELLGIADPPVFKQLAESAGLQVLGRKDRNALDLTARPAEIEAMASVIGESDDDAPYVDPYLLQLKELAETLGYIVGLN